MPPDTSTRVPFGEPWTAAAAPGLRRGANAIGGAASTTARASQLFSRRLLLLFGIALFVPLLVTTGGVPVPDVSMVVGGDDSDTSQIDSCTTITEPGRYVLTADIIDDKETHLSESCIRIESDNVVLDGAGHRVDGRGVSGTIGVHVSSSGRPSNVSVIRLTVSDWDWGIYYEGVRAGEIREATVEHNGAGVALAGTRAVTVRDNEISDNGIGVFLLDASDNSIRQNLVSDNLVGIDCNSAQGNTFDANALSGNRATGVISAC